jgi:hypothetical protein
MKLFLLALLLLSGCATQAIVKKQSCHEIQGTDELKCDKVIRIFQ